MYRRVVLQDEFFNMGNNFSGLKHMNPQLSNALSTVITRRLFMFVTLKHMPSIISKKNIMSGWHNVKNRMAHCGRVIILRYTLFKNEDEINDGS